MADKAISRGIIVNDAALGGTVAVEAMEEPGKLRDEAENGDGDVPTLADAAVTSMVSKVFTV
jgi:hypothetical protein